MVSSPQAADAKGRTPLALALRSAHDAVAVQLLQEGADSPSPRVAMFFACDHGTSKQIERRQKIEPWRRALLPPAPADLPVLPRWCAVLKDHGKCSLGAGRNAHTI